ncbi:hypothetical protein OHB49_42920 (plasmid) [Streptomyces sp. NBC_01717]|uniref:terpene synthase family protein n=1 Tax=Streptomyces sp. NBC_01717 TaxID=2975918 RepID=UPI002E3122FA|nr:hypothetical protein [Streptomyces sp. NBC_01717]
MKYVQPLHIPALYCPIPLRQPHSQTDCIQQRSLEWISGFEVADAATLTSPQWATVPRVACWMLPWADQDRLQVYADWVCFTMIDDSFDGDQSGPSDPGALAVLGSHLIRVAQCPDSDLLPGYGWANVLRDIMARLARLGATSAQLTCLVEATRAFVLGVTWEAACHRKTEMPTIDDYALMRLNSGGMLTYAALYPMLEGYELTQQEIHASSVRALTEMAATLSSWDNDFFSHFRERSENPRPINLIEVFASAHGCSSQQAVGLALNLRDKVMSRYLRLGEQVRADASENLRRYLTGLDQMIRGNIDFSMGTERYANPYNGDPAEVPWATFPRYTTDTPSNDDPEPPPLPSITWWWKDRL